MIITQGNQANFVAKDLDEVWVYGYDEVKSLKEMFYSYMPATQGNMLLQELGDVGAMMPWAGQLAYTDSVQGYRKSISENQYSLALKFEGRYLRNDLYASVKSTIELMAREVKKHDERLAASIFNNAFNTTHTVADTLALCSTAHTSNYSGTNQSNSGTSVFSAPTLEATRQNVENFETNRDKEGESELTTIIAPSALAQDVFEVLESFGVPGSGNNERNWNYHLYDAIIWPRYLTDSDRWFGVDAVLMKKFLKWIEWKAPSFYSSGDFETLGEKYATYKSNNQVSAEWRFIYGHNPA